MIIEQGNIVILQNQGTPEYVFQVTNEVYPPYQIWNIPIPDGYLPLCRPARIQPFEGACQIDADALQIIKIEGAEKIMKAAHAARTIPEALWYLSHYEGYPQDSYEGVMCERIREALPIMEQIPGMDRDWENRYAESE